MSPPISWPAVAVVGGAVTALASWILCAGVTVLGWLAAEPGSLGGALQLGTLLWLLSNGVGVVVGLGGRGRQRAGGRQRRENRYDESSK